MISTVIATLKCIIALLEAKQRSRKQDLEIEKLKLEVEKLRRDLEERGSSIAKPKLNEVCKYGTKSAWSERPKIALPSARDIEFAVRYLKQYGLDTVPLQYAFEFLKSEELFN